MDVEQKEVRIMPPDLIIKMGATALGMLALFLLVQTISSLKEFKFIGSGVTATNSITVSGTGEVFAVPDRAEFSVSVREDAKTVGEAQEEATKKTNAIIAYLKEAGVAEKDIKTTAYNVNPRYEWNQSTECRAGYCPPGKQELVGFEVAQTLSVKVKDTKKAGELLSGVGAKGASDVSGLSFTVEDEEELKEQARALAIEKAEEKAEALADALDVEVVRVVGFNEDTGGYPVPFYGRGGAMMDVALSVEKAAAPEIPAGENKIVSNVSITYEIR